MLNGKSSYNTNKHIQTSFSIKDLENLSGIKAHTIRIWEKRYNLLEPERTDTNIRQYNIVNLQKLLNVSLLYRNGYKISKIAGMEEKEIAHRVMDIGASNKPEEHAKNLFKMAMLNFDQVLFDTTYNRLLGQLSFREIFLQIFVELLDEVGILWQTNTIKPSHEHFVSNLIRQKLFINIERVVTPSQNGKKVYVLFLPENEIHELGVLYLHFELLLKGYHSIYLGISVPKENLLNLQYVFDQIEYISYFTIRPEIDQVSTYLNDFQKEVLSRRNEKMHIMGRNTKHLKDSDLPKNVSLHTGLTEMLEAL